MRFEPETDASLSNPQEGNTSQLRRSSASITIHDSKYQYDRSAEERNPKVIDQHRLRIDTYIVQ